jgi:hypothetical protein
MSEDKMGKGRETKFAAYHDNDPVVPIAEQLTALLKTAEKLNAASDRLNNTLNAFEQTLVKANIGLEVWLSWSQFKPLRTPTPELTSWEDQVFTTCTVVELGFAKLPDGWHLAARELFIQSGEMRSLQKGPYPLAQASRQERIAALPLLPALIERLQNATDQANADIEEAEKLILG